MKISKTGGIIVATGKRSAKPLMQVGSISIVRRIVISYRQAGVFPIVIITGAEDAEVKKQLSPYGVIFLRHTAPEEPELLASVKLGLRYLQGKCDKVVFTPVGVPMVTPATLSALLCHPGDVVVPAYSGKGGHPVVLSEQIIPDILRYEGPDGLQGAFRSGAIRRVWLDVEDKGVLATAHDEKELHAQLRQHNSAILRPVLHMRLESENAFFNDRLKLLLFLIADTNSMHTACAYTGIAHSKAWDMINKLEQNLNEQVVIRLRGGKRGGGTKLTGRGEQFLLAYQSFEEYVYQVAQEEYQRRFLSTGIIG